MELEEYRSQVLKKHSHKQMKVTGSWGVLDAYTAISKAKWFNIGRSLERGVFFAIIRGVNNLLAKELANGNSITFPATMGRLELRKKKKGVSIVNGKLRNSYPVDWGKTIKLWYEDKEAREKKLLIRNEQPWVFQVVYSRYKANYDNKIFYSFTLNRKIKLALKENIKNGKIDTLW